MKQALLILDLEKAFMNEYTDDLVNKVEDYVASTYYDNIVVGKFVNKMDSLFVKRLGNNKCIDKEESALAIQLSKPFTVMERTAYTMYTEELDNYLKEKQIKYVYLCGLDTEGSVYKTALDLLERGYFVYVIKSLCRSTKGTKYHDMGITLLECHIGKDYVI